MTLPEKPSAGGRAVARLDALLSARLGLVSFAIFAVFGCVVYMNTWNNEFFLDGIHLIQPYDSAALHEALTGNWEPNHWETEGYRPLSALFNHGRALLFGEAVPMHRLFLIVVMAASLALLTCAGTTLGVGPGVGVGAGLLVLAAPNNYYHITWLSDGVHLVPTFFGAVAIFAATRPPSVWRWALVHGGGIAAVLAREEGVAMYGVAVIVALVESPGPFWRRALAYAVPAGLLVLGFMVLRQILVPEATVPGRSAGAIGGYLHTWWRSALHSINLMALRSVAGRTAWDLAIAALMVAAVVRATAARRRAIALYGLFVFVGLAPLALAYRENIVLAPSLFFAVVVALCLETVIGGAGKVAGGAMLALAVIATVAMVRENMTYQQIYHPYSATALESHAWVLGDRAVHIPDVRRERLSRRLRSVGVLDVPYDQVRPEADKLVERCGTRRRPDGRHVFLPRRFQWIYEPSGLTADRAVTP